jgi:dihydrofolate reductase
MRKVIVWNLVSLDGFMAGPNGEIDWFQNIADQEFNAYSVEHVRHGTVDTLLFGRVTYQLMESYWPTASAESDDPKIIEAMNNLAKVVFSNTLKEVGWANSRLVQGEAANEVMKLKEQSGGDMMIFGSGGLVSSLAAKGLIDDYRLFVVPVVLGSGKPHFANIGERLPLQLREAKAFGNGLVALWYQPDGKE